VTYHGDYDIVVASGRMVGLRQPIPRPFPQILEKEDNSKQKLGQRTADDRLTPYICPRMR
jgi:hypothetical protein